MHVHLGADYLGVCLVFLAQSWYVARNESFLSEASIARHPNSPVTLRPSRSAFPGAGRP